MDEAQSTKKYSPEVRRNAHGEVEVFDPNTERKVVPTCGEDLISLVAYWRTTGKDQMADNYLEEVLQGKRPISAHIEAIQNGLGEGLVSGMTM